MSKLFPALAICAVLASASPSVQAQSKVDFNRDIRSILSNKCYQCHGPDEGERQAGLRLDTEAGAWTKLDSGEQAVVPGKPDQSELIKRVTSKDEDERMPPADSGKELSPREVELLTAWVKGGGKYAKHWSYVKPVRPAPPKVANAAWAQNDVDRFLLARMERDGLKPSLEADRHALIRRVSLDLTGLPPTLEEVERFANDKEPKAFERLVDRLMQKKTYGEHWARMWLDLARYADSAGYADDPPRVIWGYRDWVIQAINANKPFDQFTIEQIAGDMIPDATNDQLVATAFHRNTLTNNEGGTNDEEFRNVAIVDRVNTTMAVWMGTTMACAQCHNHKYDPISQEEYFRFFAIFNNTQDADRRDESPRIDVWSEMQYKQKAAWQAEIAKLEKVLSTPTAELSVAQAKWEKQFAGEPTWNTLHPATVKLKSKGKPTVSDDGSVLIANKAKTDVYTVDLKVKPGKLSAFRLETLPHDSLPSKGAGNGGGNFVVTRVQASITPPNGARPQARFVRVTNLGKGQFLHLAEVQVFSGADNIALKGTAKQVSTDFGGPAKLGVDGNTNGDYNGAKSTTHTAQGDDPWWEVDLKSAQPIDRIVLWNRTDGGTSARLANFKVEMLDDKHQTIWEQVVAKPPKVNQTFSPSGVRQIELAAAYADYSQPQFDAARVLDAKNPNASGWAVGPKLAEPHALTLVPRSTVEVSDGEVLTLRIEQLSKHENHTLGHFRINATSDASVASYAQTPANVLTILKTATDKRSDAQKESLTKHYLSVAPELKAQRDQLAGLKKQVASIKASTTVPIMREMAKGRKTQIQRRGNFLDKGKEVTVGLPAAFHTSKKETVNRMTLAQWLVDENNPLTARVIANRYWEAIFGRGIVPTSEEFGSQGELPTHPELLDWLATELVRLKWDTKAFIKLLVTSAAYRQTSRVTQESLERDPDNILLARGPRFRLSAEMIRDQALAVSGLLSPKMYGPPVKPPQPKLGVNAAFGSGIDWQPSKGEDRYRRGLYTTWRRSNPYPSMATFDAPNREVCTIRRDRTNTPLQALVTLNDPVYVEAAQSLARKIITAGKTVEEKAIYGFKRCLSRPPRDKELTQLVKLHELARQRFAESPDMAQKLATMPLGPVPKGTDVVDLAAWTVVGNVLLNLDEMFMKR